MGKKVGGCPGRFRPMLYFCSTTHARFAPTKHRFKYPLLYVGFPVTMKGTVGGGSLLSVKPSVSEMKMVESVGGSLKEWWTIFTVDPSKYLNPELPFDEKLHDVLLGHGLDPLHYPFAYIVTTPSFLGYSFNPVSYYYLYSATQELKLVVLEVNNTFGEKHVYVLRADSPTNPPARKGYAFAGTMEKVFHISSFNHRSGSYVIQVKDPLQNTDDMKVDVHMTVFTKEGTKSMVARAFSNSKSFDMLSGSSWQGWWIAMTWGWNNFLALPETFFEAWKLYRKKTVVHTRPEPLEGSRRRAATRAEREMQTLFLAYLKARVLTYGSGLEVKVTLPECDPQKTPPDVVFCNREEGDVEKIHLRVLNPRFFLRFFANQDPVQTLWLDYTTSKPELRPVVIEGGSIKLLRRILSPSSGSKKRTRARSSSPWTWRIISTLRTWKTSREITAASRTTSTSTPRVHPSEYFNNLDEFYINGNSACPKAHSIYKWKVLHAVLTDVIGFGDAGNLELYTGILKVGGIIGTVVSMIVAAAYRFL
ncbi:hypothetical protein K440DRAFT_553272 [Wilcoxina mikolae CBS 423.85]|nr:hypothetical protein K440DRAFT_553272 [Wilcoxina mikolae CBS 423.85]